MERIIYVVMHKNYPLKAFISDAAAVDFIAERESTSAEIIYSHIHDYGCYNEVYSVESITLEECEE